MQDDSIVDIGRASAFPIEGGDMSGLNPDPGMTMRDWFVGQAMGNPAICTGIARGNDLDQWFGPHATNVDRQQIAARQAVEFANAAMFQIKFK